MEDYLKDEIENEAKRLGISLRAIPLSDAVQVRLLLAERYSFGSGSPADFNYQNFTDFVGLHSPESWSMATEALPQEIDLYFFVNPDRFYGVWIIPSAAHLKLLLAETTGYPFYAAALDLKAAVCVDDHDCLFGLGDCKKTVLALRSRIGE